MLGQTRGASTPRTASTPRGLERLRNEIDAVDQELVEVMARRFRLAQAVGDLKEETGAPVLDPRREAEIIRRACGAARQKGIPEEGVRDLFWSVLGYCRDAVRAPAGVGP